MESWTDTYGVKWYYEVFGPSNDAVLQGVVTDQTELIMPTYVNGRRVVWVKNLLGQSLEGRAYNAAPNVKSVVMPEWVERVTGSFVACESLEMVSFPGTYETLKSIGDCGYDGYSGSFKNCRRLTTFDIPDGVEVISGGSFSDCTSLCNFTIPKSVIEIGSGSFVGCGWYNRQPDGPVVKDGCLLRYKGFAPAHVVVPDGVRIVAGGTFVGDAPSRWPNASGGQTPDV